MTRPLTLIIAAVLFSTLTACQIPETSVPAELADVTATVTTEVSPTLTASATQVPPRVLTICSLEPASLFLYGDTSSASRSVLQAVYDGPFDMLDYQPSAVILEEIPSLENGGIRLQPVEVQPGGLIIDAQGEWVSLAEGVRYQPSGCSDPSCALQYEGQEPVEMDALVANFQLRPGIKWSDGVPLTALDSVYSFKVFRELFQDVSPEVLRITSSYTALDETTVAWRGIPGYVGPVATRFFSPLPEHLWGGIQPVDLLTAPLSSRSPMGWGPYIIDEWVSGDHITTSRNPNYFRIAEGLPHFDHLVFRFMQDGDEAIDALLVGECDLIDRTLLSERDIVRLQGEQDAGRIRFAVQMGTAWELAAFGIHSLRDEQVDFFSQVEVRQAAAMCIDRQKIVDALLFGVSNVPDTYVPPNHPLNDQDVKKYEYDPDSAWLLLDEVGWLDQDSDPNTPRTASGIEGILDGTPFVFRYLVPAGGERPDAAQIVADGLSACGLGIEVVVDDWDTLMRPGPDGPLFGRQFDLAQFAWSASFEPACNLFTSQEIPGPYPEHPKGWGGGNLSGYSNPDFDAACKLALGSLPGSETYLQAHHQAQAIFASELPVIPLYQRVRLAAMRPDLCNLVLDPAANSALSHLELIDYGEGCE